MASKSMQLGHEAGASLMRSFIKSQFLTKPQRAPSDIDLTGQVAIITGGSSGLGYHAALHLLSLKLSHLILAVRSLDKGKSAANQLQARYPAAKIHVWHLEMTSYESIRAFCRQVETDLPRLDITILNAGIVKGHFKKCSTGHEESIQVNYLSTFLLAILMLPLSKSKAPTGKPGRLTIVSSGTALWAKFPNRDRRPLLPSFDDTNITSWDGVERYFSSKMLGHLFFVRLLPYLNPDEVIVNLVEPGMCKDSDLHREATGPTGVFLKVYKALTGRKPEDGARTYVDAAVVKGKESHGCFCMDWKIHPFTQLVYLPEGQPIMNVLWEETIAEFEFAGVRDILKITK
ncbi:Short chain dehydrogenase yanD [Talaromyces pinophilus]|nr:Short chain dehydrogenase yanD [Talaromyces pinophilus]